MAQRERAAGSKEKENKARLEHEHEHHEQLWCKEKEQQAAKEQENEARLQHEHEQHEQQWHREKEQDLAREQQEMLGLAQAHESRWYRQKLAKEITENPPSLAQLQQPFEQGGKQLVYSVEPAPPPPEPLTAAPVKPGVKATTMGPVMEITPTAATAAGQPPMMKVEMHASPE